MVYIKGGCLLAITIVACLVLLQARDTLLAVSQASRDLSSTALSQKSNLDLELREVRKVTADAHDLIIHTDLTLNGGRGTKGVLPGLSQAIGTINEKAIPRTLSILDRTDSLASQSSKGLDDTLTEVSLILDNLRASSLGLTDRISDPNIDTIVGNLAETSSSFKDTSREVTGIASNLHTESGLIVDQTKKAFAPKAKWLVLLQMLGGGAISAAEAYYYFTH